MSTSTTAASSSSSMNNQAIKMDQQEGGGVITASSSNNCDLLEGGGDDDDDYNDEKVVPTNNNDGNTEGNKGHDSSNNGDQYRDERRQEGGEGLLVVAAAAAAAGSSVASSVKDVPPSDDEEEGMEEEGKEVVDKSLFGKENDDDDEDFTMDDDDDGGDDDDGETDDDDEEEEGTDHDDDKDGNGQKSSNAATAVSVTAAAVPAITTGRKRGRRTKKTSTAKKKATKPKKKKKTSLSTSATTTTTNDDDAITKEELQAMTDTHSKEMNDLLTKHHPVRTIYREVQKVRRAEQKKKRNRSGSSFSAEDVLGQKQERMVDDAIDFIRELSKHGYCYSHRRNAFLGCSCIRQLMGGGKKKTKTKEDEEEEDNNNGESGSRLGDQNNNDDETTMTVPAEEVAAGLVAQLQRRCATFLVQWGPREKSEKQILVKEWMRAGEESKLTHRSMSARGALRGKPGESRRNYTLPLPPPPRPPPAAKGKKKGAVKQPAARRGRKRKSPSDGGNNNDASSSSSSAHLLHHPTIFTPTRVCKLTFQNLLGIFEKEWSTLETSMKHDGPGPLTHGNHGNTNRATNSSKTKCVDAIRTFMDELATRVGEPTVVRDRKSGGYMIPDSVLVPGFGTTPKPIVSLPPEYRKRGCYEQFCWERGWQVRADNKGTYPPLSDYQKRPHDPVHWPQETSVVLPVCAYNSFNRVWEEDCPHVKFMPFNAAGKRQIPGPLWYGEAQKPKGGKGRPPGSKNKRKAMVSAAVEAASASATAATGLATTTAAAAAASKEWEEGWRGVSGEGFQGG